MAKIWEVYLADVQHTVLMYSTPCSSTLWSAMSASRVLEPSTPPTCLFYVHLIITKVLSYFDLLETPVHESI